MKRSNFNTKEDPPECLPGDIANNGRNTNCPSNSCPDRRESGGFLHFFGVVLTFISVATLCFKLSTNPSGSVMELRGGGSMQQKKTYKRKSPCRFYLGESAIPMSGLGLFTAIDIPKGEQAQSMEDICIFTDHAPHGYGSHSFAGKMFHANYEGGRPRAACEGFATLFNSQPDYDNSRTSLLYYGDFHTNNAGLRRGTNPGAGAITYYYGITSIAARPIVAGSELTIEYGNWDYKEKSKKIHYLPSRPLDWLENQGMCIDNIAIRPATDPQMGRGAFAKRNMPQGTKIAPAPLQFYKNRTDLATRDENGKPLPEKLFLNYCMQPHDSDMLIYPYGPGVGLINHASGGKANVEYQWSTHYMHHSHWLDLPQREFWEMVYHGGMILDVVALRDIEKDEELFMDYGPEFEQAWQKHVASWVPVQGANDYIYPQDMDIVHEPFRTVEEQKTNPYQSNLITVCEPPYNSHDRVRNSREKWKQIEYEHPERRFLCNILKRSEVNNNNKYEYEVSFEFSEEEHDPQKDELKYVVYGMPQKSISFIEKPYTSDTHLPNAFRHPIGFPDKLFPSHWKKQKSN